MKLSWCRTVCLSKWRALIIAHAMLGLVISGSLALAYGQAQSVMSDSAPVAMVEGIAITENDLVPRIAAQLQKLRTQEFELKQHALEEIITEKLLDGEARREGLTVEALLQRDVEAHVGELSESEIEAFYMGQKDRLGRPLSEVRDQLREALRRAKVQQVREQYVAGVRQRSAVTVSLAPPRIQVSYDSKSVRGSATAPVTIVEFSDYHCPFCKRVQATLTQLLDRYPGKIKLAFRDLPLVQLHPQARRAAEAARCAQDQGKFWEYHDVLFAQAPKAADDDLKRYAEQVGIDGGQFASCLFRSVHHEAVQRDIDEATKLGMTGTPAFFINGRQLSGALPLDIFAQIIEEELTRPPVEVSAARQ